MMEENGPEEESPRTIHDGLFKDIFTNPENAAALLRAVLPIKLSRHIDWTTLALAQGSVVRRALSQGHIDLLYEARLHSGEPLYVWLMFEHQSTLDWYISQRMLVNAVALWTRHRRRRKKAEGLPPILSVVLYQGAEPWTAPTSVAELVRLPKEVRADWEPYLPSFRFVLEDLGFASSEGLAVRELPAHVRLGLVVMKYGRDEEVVERLLEHVEALRVLLGDEIGREALETVIVYLLRVNPKLSYEYLIRRITAALPAEEESTMQSLRKTLSEEVWRRGLREGQRKGMEEGLRKGLQEGKQEGLREALQRTLQAQIRQRFGRLPRAAAARIRSADSDELSGWLQRILQVESIDELFAARTTPPAARQR